MDYLKVFRQVHKEYMTILSSDETLKERISTEMKYSDREIEELASEFIKFLVIKADLPSQYILPSLQIDTMWHQFILHTKKYRDFCQKHFGHYIDHRPLNNNPPYTETIRLIKNNFDINEAYWKESA